MRTHDVSRTRRTGTGRHLDRPEKSPALEIAWQPPDWTNDGECLELVHDPEWWFQPPHSADTKKAKRLCTLCPVRMQCLQYALDHKIKDGTWGGLSEKELRQILDARHAPGRKHHRGYDIGYRDGKH
jgi:WhiB family redox-sensing transcriptional regulator